jgi:hypothetical protein
MDRPVALKLIRGDLLGNAALLALSFHELFVRQCLPTLALHSPSAQQGVKDSLQAGGCPTSGSWRTATARAEQSFFIYDSSRYRITSNAGCRRITTVFERAKRLEPSTSAWMLL